MSNRRRVAISTRSRLLQLVAAILLPVTVFALLLLWRFSQTESARYRVDAEQLATSVTADVDREVVGLTAALEALATSPALMPGGDLASFDTQARAVLNLRGKFLTLRDLTGQQLVNAGLPRGTPLTHTHDPIVEEVDRRVIAAQKPAVSDLFTGSATKKRLVLVEVPVIQGGATRYLLSIALEPAHLSTLLADEAPPEWTISLLDRRNVIIARSQNFENFVGLEATADLREAATDDHGTWLGHTLDGEQVLGAYKLSTISGWRTAVGVPIGLIEKPLRRLLWVLAVSTGAVLVLSGLLAAWVARSITSPLGELADAAMRLGRGDQVPALRTHLREVDEVARALTLSGTEIEARGTALAVSEERFRAAVHAVAGVVWTNDATGRMIGEQPGWSALTGQTREQYDGFGWAAAVHPDDAASTVEAWEEAVRQRSTFIFEHRVRRHDGVYRRFAIRAVPVLDAKGSVREWVGVHTDITDEFEAKRRLAESRAELAELNATLERRVAETAAERDRIWRLSHELMLVSQFETGAVATNPAWETTLGWRPGELAGRKYLDLVHPDDLERTRQELARLARGKTTERFENRLRHRDGSYRWFAWAAVPEAGSIHSIARDVTAEKEAEAALRRTEEQLRQSQKMEVVGQLTGGVAHDFNNLLTVVQGNLEMASRRLQAGSADGRLARYLKNAVEGAQRAAVLTQRLLAFARQSPLRPEVIDLNRVVGGMADLIRRTLGENIAIETVLAGGLWPTEADPNQVESAILNLCINARDAMEQGGRLTIETANSALDEYYPPVARGEVAAGQYVLIAVADTGTGMPANVRERVFEPFFTTKPVGKGTGLGLSQVFGFLRQSGGHAAIYSEPGQGTTVKLYFPRLSRLGTGTSGESEPALGAAPAGAGETVIVVEDEGMVREFAMAALEEAGYRAYAASDGPTGLALLDAHPEAALLFTDVVLAGPLDGRNVADEALRRRPDLKVLFTTGYTKNAIIHHGRLDEDVEVITKPFTASALIDKLRRVLG